MTFPIAIRTRNRPAYLDITLKSIWNTKVPSECPLLVIDDCSDDKITQEYLTTDNEVILPEEITFINHDRWKNLVGNIAPVTKLKGIKSKIEVTSPETRKGTRGGIFYCIDYMMKRFPESEAVIIIEADVVFHEDWYEAVEKGYEKFKDASGPNGEQLGLLSCYDRKGKFRKGTPDMGAGWRSLSKRSNGGLNCGNGLSGQMYLVTRRFYDATIGHFSKKHNPNTRSGDTWLQSSCFGAGFNIAVTVPSFCQHIGVDSLAWPKKGWRHTKNFKKPMAFEKIDDDGVFYSDDWL